MTHGGKREGAGRKAPEGKRIRRPIGFTPANFAWLQAEAKRRKVSMGHIVNELIDRPRTAPRGREEGEDG